MNRSNLSGTTRVFTDGRPRTVAGVANKAAYDRARQRARRGLAALLPEDFHRLLLGELSAETITVSTADRAGYYRCRARAHRRLAALHPENFRQLLAEEVAAEAIVPLKRGRRFAMPPAEVTGKAHQRSPAT